MTINSSTIISSINDIYERFKIMPSLQKHMKAVAAVGKLIVSTQLNSDIKKEEDDLIAALLLHDLGNIVKFNLETESADRRTLQKETIAKYGLDDHEVTMKMIHELKVTDRVSFLISEMGFENLHYVLNSNDMSLKICLYADQRVAPYGIVSLKRDLATCEKDIKEEILKTDIVHCKKKSSLSRLPIPLCIPVSK